MTPSEAYFLKIIKKFIFTIGMILFLGQPVLSFAENRVFAAPTQRYAEQYLLMNQLLPRFSEILKPIDPDLSLLVRECGKINSFYIAEEKVVILCYEYLNDADLFVKTHFQNQNIATQSTLESGIFFGVLFHELGHAMIHLHKIPIIGGEEDVADRIATIVLLSITAKNPIEEKTMIVGDLAYDWGRRQDILTKLFNGNQLYADEHALNEQRVYNKICLAYGSNPALFLDTALQLGLTKERAERCPKEYQDTKAAIEQLMK